MPKENNQVRNVGCTLGLMFAIGVGVLLHTLHKTGEADSAVATDAESLPSNCLPNKDLYDLAADVICSLLPDMRQDSNCTPEVVDAIAENCPTEPSTGAVVAISALMGLPLAVLTGILCKWSCCGDDEGQVKAPLLKNRDTSSGLPSAQRL